MIEHKAQFELQQLITIIYYHGASAGILVAQPRLLPAAISAASQIEITQLQTLGKWH